MSEFPQTTEHSKSKYEKVLDEMDPEMRKAIQERIASIQDPAERLTAIANVVKTQGS